MPGSPRFAFFGTYCAWSETSVAPQVGLELGRSHERVLSCGGCPTSPASSPPFRGDGAESQPSRQTPSRAPGSTRFANARCSSLARLIGPTPRLPSTRTNPALSQGLLPIHGIQNPYLTHRFGCGLVHRTVHSPCGTHSCAPAASCAASRVNLYQSHLARTYFLFVFRTCRRSAGIGGKRSCIL